MWLNKDNKPTSLKKLVFNGFVPEIYKPEDLLTACPVTHGLENKKLEWLIQLELLADETDQHMMEQRLKDLLADIDNP